MTLDPFNGHTACAFFKQGEWLHFCTHARMHTRTHAHTRTHMIKVEVGGMSSLLFPILASSARESQEQWAASIAASPGTKSKCPVLSWSGTGLMSMICSFCMFLLLLWGSMGGTREQENMQTPHRNAWEQALTCCTMQDLNPQPSCCEATVLRTEPPCPHLDKILCRKLMLTFERWVRCGNLAIYAYSTITIKCTIPTNILSWQIFILQPLFQVTRVIRRSDLHQIKTTSIIQQ